MAPVLIAIAAVILTLIVALVGTVFYQLVKQQGRLVLRLDDVERLLAQAGVGAAAQPTGFAVGAEIAPFRLPNLEGKEVGLEDFRGQRVLLVHWNPGCGYCDLIAPDLARLHAELHEHKAQLLLLAHGDAERNRQLAAEHGLEAPILLLAAGSPANEVFKGLGTPAAYLLDVAGRVSSPLAVGAEQVPALARVLVETGGNGKRPVGTRSLERSRIVRDGLKAGTPAPNFRLPDILGRGEVSLAAFRGRRVLLVFSDPECGPCQELTPRLADLHRDHEGNGVAVVMVGRGDLEANRRKAEEQGVGFPVVLQAKWELSRAYGIFATPVGFLIDDRGIISHNVATGLDAIADLVSVRVTTSGG